MFVVTEAVPRDPRRLRSGGEFTAAIGLRRLFPGITDNAQAQECARTIAGWKPLRCRYARPGCMSASDREPWGRYDAIGTALREIENRSRGWSLGHFPRARRQPSVRSRARRWG